MEDQVTSPTYDLLLQSLHFSFKGKAGYNDQLPLQAVLFKAKELWSFEEPGLLSAAIGAKTADAVTLTTVHLQLYIYWKTLL